MLRIILVPALLISAPALAESQSSDSSSDCSNGRCTRVERFVREDGRRREGVVTRESWREGTGTRNLRRDDDDDDDRRRRTARRDSDDD